MCETRDMTKHPQSFSERKVLLYKYESFLLQNRQKFGCHQFRFGAVMTPTKTCITGDSCVYLHIN